MPENDVEEFRSFCQTLENLGQVRSLLHWDQQVMMPEKGAEVRSAQNSTLAKICHQKLTSEKLGNLLENLNPADLDEELAASYRELRREHERASSVPEELEEKISLKESETLQKWEDAREENDFSVVKDDLAELVELKRKYAREIDPNREPYRVLFEDYEPYIRFEKMEKIMDRLKEELTDLISDIKDAEDVKNDVFSGEFLEEDQKKLFEFLAEKMGYSFEKGRLDTSTHPFTAGNQFDARITTRYSEDNLREGLMPTIHEAGHALYEQGLPEDLYGLPAGESRDLSIHESQSRLWENHVARSREFWSYMLSELKERFTGQFEDVTVEECYREINRVDPNNLIRVEADEVTYHLHIVIRFEIERALINGDMEVEELEEEWNDRYESYLGVRPQEDIEGVLQDIHWYQGSFGYFTTYSLGSVFAAQLYNSASEQIDGLEGKIEDGEFLELRNWLQEKIHSRSSLLKTEELMKEATGEEFTGDDFIDYVREKYSAIYGI